MAVYEAGTRFAGLAQSFRDDEGFTYDFGAHFITNRLAAALGIGAYCQDVRSYGEAVRLGHSDYSCPFGLLGPRSSQDARRTAGPTRRPGRPRPRRLVVPRGDGDRFASEVPFHWSRHGPARHLRPGATVVFPQVDRGTAHVLR